MEMDIELIFGTISTILIILIGLLTIFEVFSPKLIQFRLLVLSISVYVLLLHTKNTLNNNTILSDIDRLDLIIKNGIIIDNNNSILYIDDIPLIDITKFQIDGIIFSSKTNTYDWFSSSFCLNDFYTLFGLYLERNEIKNYLKQIHQNEKSIKIDIDMDGIYLHLQFNINYNGKIFLKKFKYHKLLKYHFHYFQSLNHFIIIIILTTILVI